MYKWNETRRWRWSKCNIGQRVYNKSVQIKNLVTEMKDTKDGGYKADKVAPVGTLIAENKWKRDHSTFYRWFLNIGCLLHLVFVRRRLGSPMRGVWWRFQRFPSHNCISGLCHILKYFDLISLAWWSASLYYTKDIHADNEHLFLLCKFHYNVGERVNKFCQVLKSYYSIIFGRTVL